MTLNEIIVESLQRLDRGTDTQTIRAYRNLFKTYANRALKRIALQYKQCRKETVELDVSHQFEVASLERECLRIVDVKDGERPCYFFQDPPGSGFVTVKTDVTSVVVVYRFVPKALAASDDVPELPLYMHDMIPYYVAACEKAGGDPDTYETSTIDYQMFNDMLNNIVPESLGEPPSFQLKHFF